MSYLTGDPVWEFVFILKGGGAEPILVVASSSEQAYAVADHRLRAIVDPDYYPEAKKTLRCKVPATSTLVIVAA